MHYRTSVLVCLGLQRKNERPTGRGTLRGWLWLWVRDQKRSRGRFRRSRAVVLGRAGVLGRCVPDGTRLNAGSSGSAGFGSATFTGAGLQTGVGRSLVDKTFLCEEWCSLATPSAGFGLPVLHPCRNRDTERMGRLLVATGVGVGALFYPKRSAGIGVSRKKYRSA